MSSEPMKPFDHAVPNTPEGSNAGLGDLTDRVSDMTARLKDKVNQVAETVSEKLGQGRETTARGLDRAASAINGQAEKAVNLTHSVTDGMQSTASYLREHDFNQMGKGVMNICRRYPVQSLIVAVAVGFLVGRSRR